MKIVVIGATGTIGAKVVEALSAKKHEVIRASRNGDTKANLDDPATIQALFETVKDVDALVSCAGNAAFKPFSQLTDADYELGIRSKLMGQVSAARIASDHLRDGGSITLTTGTLAMHPIPGSASVSLVNAGLEGFVRAAALEMPRNRLQSGTQCRALYSRSAPCRRATACLQQNLQGERHRHDATYAKK
jgi:NAD(P)-dependent dehydrogenase (short-subunit alcohol dehydrogenase family)